MLDVWCMSVIYSKMNAGWDYHLDIVGYAQVAHWLWTTWTTYWCTRKDGSKVMTIELLGYGMIQAITSLWYSDVHSKNICIWMIHRMHCQIIALFHYGMIQAKIALFRSFVCSWIIDSGLSRSPDHHMSHSLQLQQSNPAKSPHV